MKRVVVFAALFAAALMLFAAYIIGWDHGFDACKDVYEEVKTETELAPQEQKSVPAVQEIKPVFLACEIEYISETDAEDDADEELQELSGEPAAPSVTENQIGYTEDDVYCLACVIYQEAGADWVCDTCRYRVADVVLNRVADDRFPDTIRGVLEAYLQYGMFWDTGVCFPEKADEASEQEAVRRAWGVAYDVLGGIHSELYGEGYIWQSEYVQSDDSFCCCGINYGR